MTHIAIDARLLYYRQGGISTYIRRLVRALGDLNETEPARWTLLRSRRDHDKPAVDWPTAALWTPPHHRLERLSLSVELLRLRLDVLHSPDFIPPLRGARRHVITVHDLTFLHEPAHKDAAARKYYNDQINFAVHHADHILAVSEATRDDLTRMLGVPEAKITVQPHGVDERFRPLSTDELAHARAALNLPETFVLFVGTLEPRKNIPVLLDAYDLLRGKRELPPLVLVGQPGWLFDETMARIESMQADGVPVILRRDIDDAALSAVYNLARVLVLPSFYEGFGLPILEAMACGTPFIASDRSSLPEVAGPAGALINPEDADALAAALVRALDDDDWHAEQRRTGLERASAFTWRRSARIAWSVYQSLM